MGDDDGGFYWNLILQFYKAHIMDLFLLNNLTLIPFCNFENAKLVR